MIRCPHLMCHAAKAEQSRGRGVRGNRHDGRTRGAMKILHAVLSEGLLRQRALLCRAREGAAGRARWASGSRWLIEDPRIRLARGCSGDETAAASTAIAAPTRRWAPRPHHHAGMVAGLAAPPLRAAGRSAGFRPDIVHKPSQFRRGGASAAWRRSSVSRMSRPCTSTTSRASMPAATA